MSNLAFVEGDQRRRCLAGACCARCRVRENLKTSSLSKQAEEALYTTTRVAGEDILSFQTRLEAKFKKLGDACGDKLPSEIRGFVLAKQAGLATSDVREVLTLTKGKMVCDEAEVSDEKVDVGLCETYKSRSGATPSNVFHTDESPTTSRDAAGMMGIADEDDENWWTTLFES